MNETVAVGDFAYTTGLRRCHEFHFEVGTDDEALFGFVQRLCTEFADASPGAKADVCFGVAYESGDAETAAQYVLTQDHKSAHRSPSAMAMASTFGSRLTRALLDADTDRLHLHAAAVERGDSSLLVLGASGSGKSTLSAVLTSQGYRYLSDEMVALTPDGDLVPYPKAISLKGAALDLFAEDAGDFLGTWHNEEIRVELPVDLFGTTTPHAEVTVGATVDLTFDATVDLEVGSVSPAVAVRTMIENSMDFRRMGPEGLLVLSTIAASAPTYRVIYGNVHALQGWLEELQLGERPATSSGVVTPVELLSPDDPAAPGSMQAHMLRIGEESVLYETETFGVAVLDRLGTTELLSGSRDDAVGEVAEFYATLTELGMITARDE